MPRARYVSPQPSLTPPAAMSTMLVLFYLFCDGKTEDNLQHMFNMFDMDGNKVITIDELLNMMAVFIEIGEGKNHKVDLATVMAEMFQLGDRNKDSVLDRSVVDRVVAMVVAMVFPMVVAIPGV